MGKYTIRVEKSAQKDLQKLYISGNKSDITKIETIFKQLEVNPYEGIGLPEPLKHELKGYWSRRINKKDRLVYRVLENEILVIVISALGHYSDK